MHSPDFRKNTLEYWGDCVLHYGLEYGRRDKRDFDLIMRHINSSSPGDSAGFVFEL
jgi:hypothetical protein